MVEQTYELVEMQKPSIWQRHVYRPYTLRVAEVGFLTIQIKAAEEITSASKISQSRSCKIQRLVENMNVYKPTADGSGILDGFCQHG